MLCIDLKDIWLLAKVCIFNLSVLGAFGCHVASCPHPAVDAVTVMLR
jgi:hypothetical protein